MENEIRQQPEADLEPDAAPENTVAPVGDLIVWLLALSPIVGIFFEMLGIILIGMPWLILPDAIALVLCIYLAYVDQRKLKAVGHDTSRLGPPWLVPVYLFKRARMLNDKLTYFMVWCGLCVMLVLL